MFEANLFQGQRVLVTGGGTGLGLAMAAKLAELGAEVHLCGRRLAVVQQACDRLREELGARAFAHELDIRQPEAVNAVVDRIWAGHGPLTALINNAAGNFVSRTEDLSVNGFHAISDIVFRGTFYVTQAVGRRWIAEGLPGWCCPSSSPGWTRVRPLSCLRPCPRPGWTP
jgi:NAD(P)-dependent dehydrogenase (short-subunit alcohol dehydrogenase family)